VALSGFVKRARPLWLLRISQDRTVFVVAHRLSTVRRANTIFVIDKGEIIEQGNHQELLQLNGYYARLNQHQEGTYAVG
jgi:ABC-type multidrug transport system fused ATPase/permease subunit